MTTITPVLRSTDLYRTPKYIIDLISQFGTIGLDPTGHTESLVNPVRQFLLEEGNDGLQLPWIVKPDEVVFFNPPYSPGWISIWTEKANLEYIRHGSQILGLLLLDTSTNWFRTLMRSASAMCFTKRIRHIQSDGKTAGSPKFGSVIVYWGSHLEKFKATFDLDMNINGLGHVILLRQIMLLIP